MCRQMARELTQQLKFTRVDQTNMITAASELSPNTVVYGGGRGAEDVRRRHRLSPGIEDRPLMSQHGTLGIQIRRLQDVSHTGSRHAILVLHSDPRRVASSSRSCRTNAACASA